MASGTLKPTDDPQIELPPRQKAITALEPALHILERFHHRNKNQHRLSKWWSQADMLRRHLRKFIESLYDGLEDEQRSVARAARVVTAAKKKSKNGKVKDVSSGDGFFNDEFGIYERGVHIRGVLVPRAYLAFTQVTADRQFAHLGLMLLATLAQVDHAVSPFAPGPGDGDNDEPEELAGSSTIPTDQKDKAKANNTSIGPQHPTGEDIGVAISRDEFMAASGHSVKTSIEVDIEMDIDTPKQRTKLDLEDYEDTRDLTITKRKKRTREEDQEQSIVDIEKNFKVSATKVTTKTTSSSSTTTMIKEKKKKPRKKEKAGDEFDDIFGGLL